jgi:epoxyqueuosine reductase
MPAPTIDQPDRAWIEQRALAAGFSLAGIAAVPQAEDPHLAAWLAAGHAGEMSYLAQQDDAGNLLRADLRRSTPWARSVIVCAVNYSHLGTPLSIDAAPATAGWIARYAWLAQRGNANAPADYHDLLLAQLRALDAELHARFTDLRSRCYVDTGPFLERDLAARAGIGWIGKNTCVLNEQQGSWLLLGVIVTSLELAPGAWSVPAADRCGSCTRCIDACPTDALIPPATPDARRQMDASRCIAYLTIEKKGSIPEELRAPMGRQVFGCDICQDVCPWNEKSQREPNAHAQLTARPELINPSLGWLASLEGPAFTRVFRGSPLEPSRREATRRKCLRRNIAIAMGNSGETTFLPHLEAWSTHEDPALAEAATWAIGRLQSPDTAKPPRPPR